MTRTDHNGVEYLIDRSDMMYITTDGYFYTKCPECGRMTLRGKEEGDRVYYKCMGPKCRYHEVKRENDGSEGLLVILAVIFVIFLCALGGA